MSENEELKFEDSDFTAVDRSSFLVHLEPYLFAESQGCFYVPFYPPTRKTTGFARGAPYGMPMPAPSEKTFKISKSSIRFP